MCFNILKKIFSCCFSPKNEDKFITLKELNNDIIPSKTFIDLKDINNNSNIINIISDQKLKLNAAILFHRTINNNKIKLCILNIRKNYILSKRKQQLINKIKLLFYYKKLLYISKLIKIKNNKGINIVNNYINKYTLIYKKVVINNLFSNYSNYKLSNYKLKLTNLIRINNTRKETIKYYFHLMIENKKYHDEKIIKVYTIFKKYIISNKITNFVNQLKVMKSNENNSSGILYSILEYLNVSKTPK